MGRKNESLTVSLNPEQKKRLEELALAVGATWGGAPNISGLLKMIADGKITLHKQGSPITKSDREAFNEQVQKLESIVNFLKHLGE